MKNQLPDKEDESEGHSMRPSVCWAGPSWPQPSPDPPREGSCLGFLAQNSPSLLGPELYGLALVRPYPVRPADLFQRPTTWMQAIAPA